MLHSVAQDFQNLQPPVAPGWSVWATVCSVGDWTKWMVRAVEAKRRSKKTDAELAAAVTDITKRTAGRAQVNHWFTGKREPTLSQFMALCAEIGADPGYVLFEVPALPAAVSGSRASEAIKSDPTVRPGYEIQEKRLRMRRKARKGKRRQPVAG
jgi:hypothetical protein